MDFTVTRTTYWSRGWASLKHIEHSPHAHVKEGPCCGCKAVIPEKLDETPYSVSYKLEHRRKIGKYRVTAEVTSHDVIFDLEWDDSRLVRPWQKTPHANYRFNPIKHQLVTCISHLDCGNCGPNVNDFLLERLYVGNEVDTNRMEGMRIGECKVDLSKIGPTDIWAHRDSGCNTELFDIFKPCEETTKWFEFTQRCRRLYLKLKTMTIGSPSLDEVRKAFEADTEFTSDLAGCLVFLHSIVSNVENTEYFRVCNKMDKDYRILSEERDWKWWFDTEGKKQGKKPWKPQPTQST